MSPTKDDSVSVWWRRDFFRFGIRLWTGGSANRENLRKHGHPKCPLKYDIIKLSVVLMPLFESSVFLFNLSGLCIRFMAR